LSFASQGERISVGVKAHVLYSRLLSGDDYLRLLDSENIPEVVEKLKSTAYEEILTSIPGQLHRNEIESAVRSSLISQAENFIIHLTSPRDKFFRAWFSWYEAENLKSIFRHILAGRVDRDDLRRRLYPISSSKISFEKVLLAKDFTDVSDILRGTRFYKVLADSLHRLATGEERSLFPLEMALDAFVELTLYRTMNRFDPPERKMLLRIFGTRVDLHNLYTLYRAVAFYNLTPEETLNRLLPVRYRVSFSVLREAVRLNSDAMADMIRERFPAYAPLLTNVPDDESMQLTIERNINRYIYLQASRVFNSSSPDFHTAVSYFVLRSFEISDITRVIESVRYGYDRRKAAEYLVAPVISGGESEWQF
jgi:V/A-type H+-transporting ATPase subunit C